MSYAVLELRLLYYLRLDGIVQLPNLSSLGILGTD